MIDAKESSAVNDTEERESVERALAFKEWRDAVLSKPTKEKEYKKEKQSSITSLFRKKGWWCLFDSLDEWVVYDVHSYSIHPVTSLVITQ